MTARAAVRVDAVGRAIVYPPAEINMYSVPGLHADLADALARTITGDVVIECGHVKFCDECGLGALIRVYKRVREHETPAAVYLVDVPTGIRGRLELTHTQQLFELVDSLEALPALAGGRRGV